MKARIGLAGILLTIGLGGCAHRTAGMQSSTPANGVSPDRDVPSKRRGVITPSDPPTGIAGQQPTTGTDSGRIGESIGKGVGGGNTTP